MKIIIVGAGKVGSSLVKQLVAENHEITIIDKDEDKVNRVVESNDCMGIVGNGAVQSVLIDADIKNTNVIIACTSSDEVNMLTCLIAHKNSNCVAIARIRDPEYTDELRFLKNEFNLSLIINPEKEAAQEIKRILKNPSTLLSESFFSGSTSLLKIVINEQSPLCNMKLYEVQNKTNCNVVICIIERGEEIIIPKGNDVILNGDKISFVADTGNAKLFFEYAGFDYKTIKSVIIAGGGKLTYYLIKMLKDENKNLSIKVIDYDKEVCNYFASNFSDISVVYGDVSDQKLLLQEGISEVDAFLSLTGIDEENMVYSLFAKKMGCKKIFTKINKTTFGDTLRDLDIGSIIDPKLITANRIIKRVRSLENNFSDNIVNFYSLCSGKVEALEFYINDDNEVTNKKFRDLNINNDAVVACIKRDNTIIIPNGNDVLMKKDNVVIVTKDLKVHSIEDILFK